MAILTTGNTFASGDQMTASALNAAVNSATFASGAVDNSTTQLSGGAIIVKDGGITSAKLASSFSTIDINGGTIDGATVGASSPSTGAFTTLSASGTSTLGTVTCTTLSGSSSILGSAIFGFSGSAGGSVTQLTSRTTGVTLNKPCGRITTHTASLAAGASATFTVTDSSIAAADIPVLSIVSGQTNKETTARVTAVAAGSFDITVHNQHASTAETGAILINFANITGDI